MRPSAELGTRPVVVSGDDPHTPVRTLADALMRSAPTANAGILGDALHLSRPGA